MRSPSKHRWLALRTRDARCARRDGRASARGLSGLADAFFFAGARAIDAACPWTIRPVQRLARVVVVSANYASKQMNLFLLGPSVISFVLAKRISSKLVSKCGYSCRSTPGTRASPRSCGQAYPGLSRRHRSSSPRFRWAGGFGCPNSPRKLRKPSLRKLCLRETGEYTRRPQLPT
jgi:hypothetical protein